MIDEDLRALERAVSEAPNDEAALLRLEAAWTRKGLGWNGEDLRSLIDLDRGAWLDTRRDERRVYRWLRHDTPIEASPELVYVPGGEAECYSCRGTGWEVTHTLSGPERDACDACFWKGRRPGLVTIAPFYIGRFQVTWEEYRAFCWATTPERIPCFPWEELRPEHGRHPVVRVSGQDARDFCAWSGLRLPTREEWRWAALGPLVAYPPEDHVHHAVEPSTPDRLYCLRCGDTGPGLDERPCMRHKLHPWGDTPETPERCVWEGHPVYGGKHTAPVTERARDLIGRGVKFNLRRNDDLGELDRFYPARPDGKSWCGAHDMSGNVWEWRDDMTAQGGSFLSECGDRLEESLAIGEQLAVNNGTPDPGFRRDDIGFRVALSVSPSR